MKKFNLNTGRLVLRSLKTSDIETILPNVNDLFQTRFLTIDPPISKKKELDWIHGTWRDAKKGVKFVFGVENRVTHELMGTLELHDVNKVHKRATAGIFIFRKYWGNGFGTEAMQGLLKFGFNTLKLHRIESEYITKNERSKNLHKVSGFRIEGTRRKYYLKRGRFEDTVSVALLAEEWKRKQKNKKE